MRITVAFNLKTKNTEEQAELLLPADIARLCQALKELRHEVTPVEVSGRPNEIIEKLVNSEPDFIFNVAEGLVGDSREAFYPIIYESLNIPYTGSKAPLLLLSLNKHLTKTILRGQGINVPKGVLLTKQNKAIPEDLRYPLIVKPNAEGSSKGITQKSVVDNKEDCEKVIDEILEKYPTGIIVEEFIKGRELSVPMLEALPDKILCVVEHIFDLDAMNAKYNIYDYGSKLIENNPAVQTICPANVTEEERQKIIEMSKRIFKIMNCKDMGRLDLRLDENGDPYFIEINPLPSLLPDASVVEAAKTRGLNYKNVINLILKSAIRNYKLTHPVSVEVGMKNKVTEERPTLRENGVSIGVFRTGANNSITDVKGVKVGHLTYIKNNAEIPHTAKATFVRTGITSIIPCADNIFENPLPAGGFVLNGRGEMFGLTQVLEWERLETPILLCNTMSVGRVHDGIITYLLKKYPSIIKSKDAIIPLIGEADDSYLNDQHLRSIVASDIKYVMDNAKSGKIQQGSVGAGTGMSSFGFAGGIGTSSRILPRKYGNNTLGVLVLSNFGQMRNLTIKGAVVGEELEKIFTEEKQKKSGSIVVIIATDAPLLSSQLNRLSKRAALGLGKVGSFASTTSGEIIVAFSTNNRLRRDKIEKINHLNMKFVSDNILDILYEAAEEAVEEAVINAMFCSSGMDGCNGRQNQPIPHDEVIRFINR